MLDDPNSAAHDGRDTPVVVKEPIATEAGFTSSSISNTDGAPSVSTEDAREKSSVPISEPALPSNKGPPILQFNADSLDSSPNTLILSSDGVFLAAHSHVLLGASSNNFANLLTCNFHLSSGFQFSLLATEPCSVLAVVLLSLYSIACDIRTLSFQCLGYSIFTFRKYGLTPIQKYVTPGKPVYQALLPYASIYPIGTYVLAAAAGLEELAVVSSAYTLSIPFSDIPQKLVDMMRTSYMRQLYELHRTRGDVLRSLLDEQLDIQPHVMNLHCSAEKRQGLSRRYEIVCLQIYYSASPAITAAGIETPIGGLVDSIDCPDCKASLQKHSDAICAKWSSLSVRTIAASS